MTKFKIKYIDPQTEESLQIIREFNDSFNPIITAYEWAEDYAYSITDKGWYEIEVVN